MTTVSHAPIAALQLIKSGFSPRCFISPNNFRAARQFAALPHARIAALQPITVGQLIWCEEGALVASRSSRARCQSPSFSHALIAALRLLSSGCSPRLPRCDAVSAAYSVRQIMPPAIRG